MAENRHHRPSPPQDMADKHVGYRFPLTKRKTQKGFYFFP